MAPIFVTIVRHGETSYNASKTIQGHLDIPLNTQGEAQALVAAKFLAATGVNFGRAWSSDLGRARKTAEIILGEQSLPTVELGLDERIRERHLGAFQGKHWDDPKADRSTIETAHHFNTRLLAFWDFLFSPSTPPTAKTKPETILIASHGGSIRHLIAALMSRKEYTEDRGGEEGKIEDLRVENCSFTRFRMEWVDVEGEASRWQGKLESYANSAHFSESSRAPSRGDNADIILEYIKD